MNGKSEWISKNWWQLVCFLGLLLGVYGSYKETQASIKALAVALEVHGEKPFHDGMSATNEKLVRLQVTVENLRADIADLEKKIMP